MGIDTRVEPVNTDAIVQSVLDSLKENAPSIMSTSIVPTVTSVAEGQIVVLDTATVMAGTGVSGVFTLTAKGNLVQMGIPSGGIIMWSGSIANIPSGWFLCDGTNSTPDLRDKFIVGAKQDNSGVANTNLTGSLTQSGGNVNHTHEYPHTHGITGTTSSAGGHISLNDRIVTTDSQSTTTTGNNSTVAVPYYAIAFIQKS